MFVPHHRFLTYLVTLGHSPDAIAGICRDLDLPLPAPAGSSGFLSFHEQWDPAAQGLPFWAPTLSKQNLPMRRWLQRAGVLPLWEDTVTTGLLAEVLHAPAVRVEVETLLLQGVSTAEVAQAAGQLGLYLPDAAVEAFKHYLWDLSGMGAREWSEYFIHRWAPLLQDVVQRQSDDVRTRFETSDSPVDVLVSVRALREMALRKMRVLSRGNTSGQETIAMATLGKVALEALARESEILEKNDAKLKPDDLSGILERFNEQLAVAYVEAPTPLLTLEQLSSTTPPMKPTGVRS